MLDREADHGAALMAELHPDRMHRHARGQSGVGVATVFDLLQCASRGVHFSWSTSSRAAEPASFCGRVNDA